MVIEPQLVAYIKNAVTLAKSLGIDDMIFEEGRVRAMDETQSVIILQSTDVPEFPFVTLGIARSQLLLSRLALMEGRDGYTVKADSLTENGAVKILTMNAKGGKAEFRTPNPESLRAPKVIHDQMNFSFTLNEEAIDMISRASNAMPQNKEDATLTFIGSTDGVRVNITDKSNEVFSWEVTDTVNVVDGSEPDFAHRYPVDRILNILKRRKEGITLHIGSPNGILRTSVLGLDVFLLPRK